jgi:hypothetical protein
MSVEGKREERCQLPTRMSEVKCCTVRLNAWLDEMHITFEIQILNLASR